jgi:hypothetical protein
MFFSRRQIWIRSDVHIPGTPNDQCSFRSEAAGLLSACVLISRMCKYYHVSCGAVTLACDGLSALRGCGVFDEWAQLHIQHYDLIEAILRTIRGTSITWKLKHVKGHQTGTLDLLGELNRLMDLACKDFWKQLDNTEIPAQFRVTGEPWPIWLGGKKVASNLKQALIKWCQEKSALEYWNTKSGADTVSELDWEIVKAVNRGTPPDTTALVSKTCKWYLWGKSNDASHESCNVR